jgi:hypothetical protein
VIPFWYGDFRTGDRVRMRYTNPPLSGDVSYAHAGSSTSTCEGVLDRFSMDPVEGYPWNATPHAVSLAVIDEYGYEHRPPITQIIELHPVQTSANVVTDGND